MTEGLTMTKENNYLSANKVSWKFISKSENFATGLLQIARVIAKCDGFITNCDMCYEVR